MVDPLPPVVVCNDCPRGVIDQLSSSIGHDDLSDKATTSSCVGSRQRVTPVLETNNQDYNCACRSQPQAFQARHLDIRFTDGPAHRRVTTLPSRPIDSQTKHKAQSQRWVSGLMGPGICKFLASGTTHVFCNTVVTSMALIWISGLLSARGPPLLRPPLEP